MVERKIKNLLNIVRQILVLTVDKEKITLPLFQSFYLKLVILEK